MFITRSTGGKSFSLSISEDLIGLNHSFYIFIKHIYKFFNSLIKSRAYSHEPDGRR